MDIELAPVKDLCAELLKRCPAVMIIGCTYDEDCPTADESNGFLHSGGCPQELFKLVTTATMMLVEELDDLGVTPEEQKELINEAEEEYKANKWDNDDE